VAASGGGGARRAGAIGGRRFDGDGAKTIPAFPCRIFDRQRSKNGGRSILGPWPPDNGSGPAKDTGFKGKWQFRRRPPNGVRRQHPAADGNPATNRGLRALEKRFGARCFLMLLAVFFDGPASLPCRR